MRFSSTRVSTVALASAFALLSGCASTEAEDPVFEGTFSVTVDADEPMYGLELASGEYYRLRAPEGSEAHAMLDGMRGGSTISVVGKLEGKAIEVSDVTVPDLGVQENALTTLGPRKLLVIVTSFSDAEHVPVATVNSQVFSGTSSLKNYMETASFGKVTLSGRTVGPYRIPGTKTSCVGDVPQDWKDDALAAARAAGHNPDDYQNVMVYLPRVACGWAGLGNMGGKFTWINGNSGSGALLVMAHELGHNFGLGHADLRRCKDAAGAWTRLSDNCTHHHYADSTDIMGNQFAGDFSAYHKERLGWLGTSNVKVVSEPGRYTIKPVETASSGFQSLRIPTTEGTFYALELRKAAGVDAALPAERRGVQVRLTTGPTSWEKTQMIDMTPDEAGERTPTLALNSLFSPPSSAYTMKVVSLSADSATIEVALRSGGPTPVANTSFDNKTVRLISEHSRLALEVADASRNDRVKIQQWAWDGGSNQKFRFERMVGNTYRIVALHSNKCLDVTGWDNLATGIDLQQMGCSSDAASQRFVVEPAAGGGLQIRNTYSGKCIDVEGRSTANGGVIHQWNCHGRANQKWRLEPQTP